MRTVWKFPLEITDFQAVFMPPDAGPLHVAFQGEALCLWAEIPDSRALANWRWPVWIVGTGNPMQIGRTGTYVGTAHNPRGFVWHVYIGAPE